MTTRTIETKKTDKVSKGSAKVVLVLLKFFLENCDEENFVTMRDIEEALQNEGIKCKRETIVKCFDNIKEILRLEVVWSRGRYAKYYLKGRNFAKEEVKLMTDGINAVNILDKDTSEKLKEKLKKLVSAKSAEKVNSSILSVNAAKTGNEQSLKNIDIIQEAINENKQVRFDYYAWKYENGKLKLDKKREEKYKLSPGAMILANDRYYMYGYDIATDGSLRDKPFRIDKMRNIEILEDTRKIKSEDEIFDASRFVSQHMGMFIGDMKLKEIEVRIPEYLLGAFVDQYGEENIRVRGYSEDELVISFTASPTSILYGWIAGLGDVEIIGPEEVRKQMLELLENNRKKY